MIKLEFWVVRLRLGGVNTFLCLTEFIVLPDDKSDEIKANSEKTNINHFHSLRGNISHYFSAET
jgi:hypothetical protein